MSRTCNTVTMRSQPNAWAKERGTFMKKLLFITLTLMLLLTMCACGDASDNTTEADAFEVGEWSAFVTDPVLSHAILTSKNGDVLPVAVSLIYKGNGIKMGREALVAELQARGEDFCKIVHVSDEAAVVYVEIRRENIPALCTVDKLESLTYDDGSRGKIVAPDIIDTSWVQKIEKSFLSHLVSYYKTPCVADEYKLWFAIAVEEDAVTEEVIADFETYLNGHGEIVRYDRSEYFKTSIDIYAMVETEYIATMATFPGVGFVGSEEFGGAVDDGE